MSATPQKFQRSFLSRLQTRFVSRSEMVRELGETLNVGRDAIYRRLRGDTVLTADELVTLSRAYRIPVEEGRELTETPALYYHASMQAVTCETDYFEVLRRQTAGVIDLPNAYINYATPELPLIYELATPTLRAFKVYVFGTTTWGLPKWENTLFDPNMISPETDALIDSILNDAASIPGRELWSIGILDVTLRQITHMLDLQKFADPSYFGLLFDELEAVVDHLERMARSGKRFPFGGEPGPDSPNFEVYHNELSITNNAILINSDTRNILFSTLVNPNYVTTEDPRVINDVNKWFNRLIGNANALNASAGKYTNQYFGRLRRQIALTRERADHVNIIF